MSMEEPNFPSWINSLFETLAESIDLRGPASLEGRYYGPDDTSLGKDLLEIAPALLEIEIPGPADGEKVYGIYENVNILELQQAFEEVSSMAYGFDSEGEPQIWMEGKVDGQEVAVILYSFPFKDTDISGTIGSGSIRLK
jgi:hypothetical protein